MGQTKLKQNQRLSASAKNARGKQWYKDQADFLDTNRNSQRSFTGPLSEVERMQINYDQFNNILNKESLKNIANPYDLEARELPDNITNRDISSGKIKAVLGMEMKRPFPYRVEAVNREATTRRETEQSDMIRKYVQAQIMLPIKQQVEIKYQEQLQNKELSEEERKQIQEQIAQEMEALTPPAVLKYMKRDHQDPAEIQGNQIMRYLVEELDMKRKFNKGMKHAALSAKEIYYVGIFNGAPALWNVNSMRWDGDISPDNEFVEDGEWATCEYRMSPSQVVSYFSDEITPKQIDRLYTEGTGRTSSYDDDNFFEYNNLGGYYEEDQNTVRVLHTVWKSLSKIGFLKYLDSEGALQETIVFENYKLNIDAGDVDIEWEWIPEVYQTWKVLDDMYFKMGPIPGQFKDLNNLYKCKLPYIGAVVDSLNSVPTGIMDRIINYQASFNVIMHKLDVLLASDKGKKIMMNINAIPDSAEMDMKTWQHFFENSPFMWYDNSEEGTIGETAATLAKEIDLSLVSDISKYINLAEFYRKGCGDSIGVTEAVEGQAGPNESVGNNQQNLVQTSHILEPYFNLHDNVKKNVYLAVLETAKIAYAESQPEHLTYTLDDMSREIINMDYGLLDSSTFGIFVSNTTKADETKEILRQLSHAALQNQKIELSDVLSVINQEGVAEAEEILKIAEDKRRKADQMAQEAAAQQTAELDKRRREHEKEEWEHEKELIILKEEERRKTELMKASVMAASFNPDQDKDNDGVNDFIELARDGINADIKAQEISLNRDKFEHDKIIDKEKIKIENKKISASKKKS